MTNSLVCNRSFKNVKIALLYLGRLCLNKQISVLVVHSCAISDNHFKNVRWQPRFCMELFGMCVKGMLKRLYCSESFTI